LSLITAACALAAVSATAAGAAVDPFDEMSYCSNLGPKLPGSAAGREQADRIAERFRAAGLETSFEDFDIPVFVLRKATLQTVGANAQTVTGESFAYGAAGKVEAEVVNVGTGRSSDYAGVDAEGKIVMVHRDTAFHRSSQLTEVISHKGAAMLYVSGSPDNLIQTGAVKFAQDLPAAIPAVTVGADDGAILEDRLANGGLRMRLKVSAERQNGVGRNVIGFRRGTTQPDKYVVVGGHYDNWHHGAIDNCTAVGSLLAVADAVKDVPLAYSVVFGAWDAEEVGLTGSYDYVKQHPDIVADTVFNENLEMTAAGANDTALRFGTTSPALLAAAAASGLANGYAAVDVPAVVIRQSSGGIIPTDLQPFYSSGVHGLSTFTNTSYYHTNQDTPDKVDRAAHQRVSEYLADLLVNVQSIPPAAFATGREVPTVTVDAPSTATPGTAIKVQVHIDDTAGNPLTGQTVKVLADQHDNWAVAGGQATELGGGNYEFTFPAGSTEAGLTTITATLNRPSDYAEGYATIDQRKGGILPAASSICRRARKTQIKVKAPAAAGRITKLTATTTRGKVKAIGRRAVRLDLRKVRRGSVTVTVAARTKKAGTIRQHRTYRTCATSSSLRSAVGGSD
jgi:Zn-dependent M28 family amino/carboxypeptidase